MNLRKLLPALSFFLVQQLCFAQGKSSFEFGRITTGDFQNKIYSIDSNASAIILADVGSTSFVGNKKGWFTMIFKRHERIRILRNAAMDLATVKIVLYKREDDQESLEEIKATTYNENNGTVTETLLDKHDIFEDRLDKNHTEKKFTMPAVKEGSLIDITYTIKSDFLFNLQPWTFQHESYPCLWSEYEVSVPGLINYMFLKQGFNKYYIEKEDQKAQTYLVTLPADRTILGAPDRELSVSTINSKHHWVMKDLPALNEVDHLASTENYLDKIEFQLYQISDGENVRDVMNTWPKVTEELMKEEDFAGALNDNNFWLDKDVEEVAGNTADQLEISKKMYEFVKNNYTSTGHGYFIKTKLFDVYKNKKGNPGEISLILTAMLRKKGITADPVLVSTRRNGRPYDKYPMLSKYNYAFCRAVINNQSYYLDAGHPFLGFGRLDADCYNGIARVINHTAESIDLQADSLKENKITLVSVSSYEDGSFRGTVSKRPGYYESCHLREVISQKGNDDLYNEIKKSFLVESQINNLGFDSLKQLNQPLGIHYDFVIKPEIDKIFYVNPFFGEAYEKNFFKSEERLLPVEMDFPANRTYSLNFEIPKGYTVDELPKSIKIKLNDRDDGMFEYLIQGSDSHVFLRARLVIKRTYFSPDEYDTLREFFNLIVKKQGENIVFRKIN